MKLKTLALVTMSAAFLSACSSSPTVSYVDPNTVDTTSIAFNSTDLQTTAKSMVDQMLTFPPIVQLTQNSTPVIFVDTLANNTSDFIDTQAITDTISTELIQSGKFQFVDMTKVKTIKNQLNYQNKSGMVNPATAAKLGQQIGAQYMLYGDISSINAMNSNQQSLYYQITMKLLNVQTGIIVWQGQQQIRKVAQKKTFGW
jgi:penicillin-binding protein activator